MIRAYADNLLQSFSYLLLTKNSWFGFVLLCLSFVNPSAGILSLVAYLSITAMGHLIGLTKEQMISSMFSYNSVLVGLSMGYLFQLSPLSVSFTIIASFFTLLLSYAIQTIFSNYLRLPILNLPFTITATVVYLSSIRYSNLYVTNATHLNGLNIESFPIWLSGLFKSVGILIFLPYDIVGMLILIGMLIVSRINFFLIIIGYYSGTLFLSLLKGSQYIAFTDVYSFNYILVSVALGGLFLIPSVKSYITAISGVLISVFILDAMNILWASYSIPAFTFPFALIVLLVLYVLIICQFPLVTTTFLQSPEQNLEHYCNYSSRFNNLIPQPQLPFSGEWTVYQPFYGEWTHKGIWSHAIDFFMNDQECKKSYRTNGARPDDYFCYGKPVLSPVSGRIVEVVDECEDNQIGIVDKQNSWGNYVILFSDWNYYVELSHFAKGSIVAKVGDYVVQGQFIGKCGNSGNSPEPHIHMQCQYLPHIGAPTVPFTFTNCLVDQTCILGKSMGLQKAQVVRSVIRSKTLDRKLQFVPGDTFSYAVQLNRSSSYMVQFAVFMDSTGNYYFTDNETNARLYFTNRDGLFCFYRHEGSVHSTLRFLFLAIPRIPVTDESVDWSDDLNYLLAEPDKSLLTFVKSFNHTLFKANGLYSMYNGTVAGKITITSLGPQSEMTTLLHFDNEKGFKDIEITSSKNRYVLRRCDS